jgi:DNA ligase-1|tara:strand:+ start:208 stop:1332 length:1125 start_codon:yes stop_codon:yes gene_type:complete
MQNISSLPTLYKRDTKGKVRELTIDYGWNSDDDAATRSTAGIQDGKLVTSGWKKTVAKNVGRANSTTAYTQAISEAMSIYDRKLEKEYFKDIKDIDSYTAFKPMLAGGYKKNDDIFPVIAQPKLDGIRCIANKSGLWTRANKPITSCPHIWEEIKPIFDKHPEFTFDGELYNHELKDDFNKITSLVRKQKTTEYDTLEAKKLVQYHVYDMYDTSHKDLIFSGRFFKMGMTLSDMDSIKVVETILTQTQDGLDELYSTWMEDGYEGQMVRIDEAYENKRSKFLLKRKEFITDEFQVVSMLEGKGNWAGYVKHFVLRKPDGTNFGAGVRGTQKVLEKLWNDGNTPDWATLRYFNETPDGIPRFPVVIDYGFGQRED